jgi:hypothetical protein
MGVEPLEDTLPLPQIVRTMKSIAIPSYGSSISVSDNSTSGNVDGGGQPSSQARRQETRTASSEECREICERSDRDHIWDEVGYLLDSLESTKASLTNGTDWDQCELDWIEERYRICKQQAMHYVLCLNLSEVIQQVSYPGERLSYLEIAGRVVEGCTEKELAMAIREIGLNPFERVYFKADPKCPPLEQLEQLLLTMLGDADYLLAKDFNEKLNLNPHSATYMAVKKNLTEAGWKWSQKKVKGKVIKVIQAPG